MKCDNETTLKCARAAHDVNAVYCAALGDTSQVSWKDAPPWQRDSAVSGALFVLLDPDAGDSASHDYWWSTKVSDGWVYGDVKDPDAKTHPCMVPYGELPAEQRAKNALFRATVIGVASSRE